MNEVSISGLILGMALGLLVPFFYGFFKAMAKDIHAWRSARRAARPLIQVKPRWKRWLQAPALFMRHYRIWRRYGSFVDTVTLAWRLTLLNLA